MATKSSNIVTQNSLSSSTSSLKFISPCWFLLEPERKRVETDGVTPSLTLGLTHLNVTAGIEFVAPTFVQLMQIKEAINDVHKSSGAKTSQEETASA
jgi:hypothetical protein